MKIQKVTVNNYQVSLSTSGKGLQKVRKTLVLIHGAGCNHAFWEDQLEAWEGEIDIVAPDLPGHGETDGAALESMEQYAQWLQTLTATLDLSSFILLGHSMGGGIVLRAALDRIPGLEGLVLCSTGARMPVNSWILENAVTHFSETLQLAANYCFPKEAPEAWRRRIASHMATCPPESLYWDFRVCNEWNARDRVHEISLPALILHGDMDMLTPLKFGAFLHENMANSKLVVLDGTGHMPMIERKERFNEEVLSFVRTISGN
ncbi:MAG: alpha/beta hydrolase [Deltaproteobacteria bacterium]|nr:alpha/beta hydrolase [Deltaproteobacteria bacterium]